MDRLDRLHSSRFRRLLRAAPLAVWISLCCATPPSPCGAAPRTGSEILDSHFGLFQAGSPQPPDSVDVDPLTVSSSSCGWMNRGFSPNSPTVDIDNWVRWVQSMAMEPIITLQSLVAGDSLSSPPADTLAWQAWVAGVVERYDGDGFSDMTSLGSPLLYWHVEQEWHLWWSGTVDEYLAHLAMTYSTIRAADPAAQVILIGLATQTVTAAAVCLQGEASGDTCIVSGESVDEATRMLREGTYDIVDMHSYETWPIIAAKIAWVRSVARDPNVPIWVLEGGGPSGYDGRESTDATNAAAVVQQFAQALGNGIQRYAWALFPPAPGSTFDYVPWTTMPLTSWYSYPDSLSIKPAYYSYRLLVRMLSGFSSASNVSTGSATDTIGAFMYRFQLGDSVVYVVWNSDSLERDISFPIEGPAALVTHIVTEPGATDADALVEMVWPVHGIITYAVTPTPVMFKFVEAVTAAPPLLPPPDQHPTGWTLDIRPDLGRDGVRFRVHGARPDAPAPRALVYDVRGRLVREVSATLRPAPAGDLDSGAEFALDGRWDGRAGEGATAASGVYFLAIVPRTPAAAQRAVVARIIRITH